MGHEVRDIAEREALPAKLPFALALGQAVSRVVRPGRH
jgi:hypothetical protein